MSSKLPFVAKMGGDDVDVEPFLVSQNTLGNDEPQLKFSRPKSNDGNGMQWWFRNWQCGSGGGG